jgi:hypothetical protein
VLNVELKKHGLFFGPETSTANRAMIGGMLGNNSCGSNSVVYGSTRDHVLAVEGYLSDGSFVRFEEENPFQTLESLPEGSRLKEIYTNTLAALSKPENQTNIQNEFPKPSIHRRNTGYAVDMLLNSDAFIPGKPAFNFCALLSGSEGTLCFATKIKLHVDPLPPAHLGLVCGHFNSIDEALRANLIALTFNQSKNNLQFVVTTHSPYVLTALNNLLQAGLLYESLDGDRLLSLQTVMPQFKTLEPKDISAYAFMAGGCSTIIEPETGLIDASIIDSVSDILAIEFDALIGID